MKKNRIFSLALAALFAVSITACQKDSPLQPGDDGTNDEVSLDLEYGGYNTKDELPAFGDQSMLSEFSDDADAQDEVAADPAVSASIMSADEGIPAYFVRLTWGMLQGDSTATETMDWSGYAEISKGTLAVLKVVRFERGDHINRPRESRQKVEFTSQTSVHFDGLLLAIIDNDTAATDVEGTLTFTAGSYSRTFTFTELDSMELLESVDDNGNEVSIISRSKNLQPFAGGFLAGRWIRVNDRGGKFRGRWINSTGDNAGFLKGIWGVNNNGARVFFGKYINLDGAFGGLLRGVYGTNGINPNEGWLEGRWINRDKDVTGKLRGVWRTGRPGSGRGYFHGRWAYKTDDSSDGGN